MVKFLTTDWFKQVEQLNQQAKELHLAPALANMILNIKITDDQDHKLHLKQGKIYPEFDQQGSSTISIDKQTLSQIIQSGDINLAIEAFMVGKIRVDGDMGQVLALQSTKPSPEQKILYKNILAITEF